MHKVQPQHFKDLAHQVALLLTGPIQSGTVQHYVKKEKECEPVIYFHPYLEPILCKSYGVLLFWEDVSRIACAGRGIFMGRGVQKSDHLVRSRQGVEDEKTTLCRRIQAQVGVQGENRAGDFWHVCRIQGLRLCGKPRLGLGHTRLGVAHIPLHCRLFRRRLGRESRWREARTLRRRLRTPRHRPFGDDLQGRAQPRRQQVQPRTAHKRRDFNKSNRSLELEPSVAYESAMTRSTRSAYLSTSSHPPRDRCSRAHCRKRKNTLFGSRA